MQKDKISVIIPVYKVEKYLDKCVDSIVRQTYDNLEIILVDDGSPDGCPQMCDEWAKKDDRIKVIHKNNGGLSDARNVGLDMMTGDYVMFVDSDDYVSEKICENLYDLLVQNNVDFSMCEYAKFYDNEPNVEVDCSDCENIQLFDEQSKLNPILYVNVVPGFCIACGKLYKKSLFDNLRYRVGKIHEDEFAITEILKNVKNYVITSSKKYYYLQRSNSIMGARNEKSLNHALEAFEERRNEYIKLYPEKSDQINHAFLIQLRGLYVTSCKKFKSINTRVVSYYKSIYKQIHKPTTHDKFFRYCRSSYKLLFKLKNIKR